MAITPFKYLQKHKKSLLTTSLMLCIVFIFWFVFFALPDPLFQDPTSTVIEDQHDHLLGARIAKDGQWRFPALSTVPDKFVKCIVTFEDKRFFHHPGVDPLAMMRAVVQNMEAGEIQSGASTLSMQVIRLSRKGKARTYVEKVVESILALRLELRFNKRDILALYASHAPFGGNVVGLDAASWRYFSRSPNQLSWAETATLAVLPNAPSLIHPGRNREALLKKRNLLLRALLEANSIDKNTYELSLLEDIPEKPRPLPDEAPHLLGRMLQRQPGQRIETTLDRELQAKARKILQKYHRKLILNDIHNGAIVVVENQTAQVKVYLGNSGNPYSGKNEQAVDMIPALRSTGSLLKPFLYAGLLQDGKILPQSLLPDIPTNFSGYSPKNFNFQYEGAVPADLALARSLNIPAVRMQRMYGTEKFLQLLKSTGLKSLDKPASYYGLALVLGGAESSMWQLVTAYSGLARTLWNHEHLHNWNTDRAFMEPSFLRKTQEHADRFHTNTPLNPGAIWHTLEALKQVDRPEAHGLWQYFNSATPIAWKTGTSFGFRDAWAIGLNTKYTVAVWVGNADGEGRPGLTGISAAAPILFEVLRILDSEDSWFAKPGEMLVQAEVCAQSGFKLNRYCTSSRQTTIPKQGLKSEPCPYHKRLWLDASETFRVNSNCYPVHEMTAVNWFVLPPGMAWFYRQSHPSYKPPPPFKDECQTGSEEDILDIVYPQKNAKILVPVELTGKVGRSVFEAVHQIQGKTIYWHLDEEYLGETRSFHQMAIYPKPGIHTLTLIDEDGHRTERVFEFLEND